MSDRELVQIDTAQFNRLDLLLETVTNALWAINEQLKRASGNEQVLKAIQILTEKVDKMSTNIDRIEKEAGELADDVAQVKSVIDGLNTNVTDLKAVVADLQAQVAQGQLDQARLDAAASKLEGVDNDLDAITLPPAPAEPPAGG